MGPWARQLVCVKQSKIQALFFLHTPSTEGRTNSTCWNCSFDLLFIAFVIIIIQNGLPQRMLSLPLTVKVLFSRTLSTYRWQEGRN